MAKIPLGANLKRGIIWNFSSLFFLAISGISLNVIIGGIYGASALGVFSQAYAIFMVMAQLSLVGVNLSVLRSVSKLSMPSKETNSIISYAIILVLFYSLVFVYLLETYPHVIGQFYNSDGVVDGIRYSIWSLPLFSVNQIILSATNGFQKMKAYAIFMSTRYIGPLLFLLVFLILGIDKTYITMILGLGELLLFTVISVYSFQTLKFRFNFNNRIWAVKHIKFGSQAFIGNILVNVSDRLSILILGLFVSDSAIGVYSFASTVVDGLRRLPMIVRLNINPYLTKYYYSNQKDKLLDKINSGVKSFYKFMLLVSLTSAVGYTLFITIFFADSTFSSSIFIFYILIAGVLSTAGYIPFWMIFVQCGFPAYHTLFLLAQVVINLLLNVLLIQLYGVYGAAMATSLSFAASIITFKIMVRKIIKIDI